MNILKALLRYFEFKRFTGLPLFASKNFTNFKIECFTSFDAFETNGASIESM
jgi:hypothetical protein